MLGKVYFPGPSALLNGFYAAQGVERCANTAKVMGAVCTWVTNAINICIEGAAKHLEWKHPANTAGCWGCRNGSAPDNSVGFFSLLTCSETSSVVFMLSEFHDPQAFET